MVKRIPRDPSTVGLRGKSLCRIFLAVIVQKQIDDETILTTFQIGTPFPPVDCPRIYRGRAFTPLISCKVPETALYIRNQR
jgi:hypothetical protein